MPIMSGSTAPFVVCKPQPNGAVEPSEFYFYAGSLNTLTRVTNELISTYEAFDDDPSPNHYVLPYQRGWLLEFRQIGFGVQQWVVFAQNGQLYLDDGEQHLLPRSITFPIRFRRVYCFTRVRVEWRNTIRPKILWIYTPISRLIFRDPVGAIAECEPMLAMLNELATPVGYDKWLQRWTSGIAHENPALTVRT